MTTVETISCEQAEMLGGQICAAAAMSAQSECQLLELLGEFDATNAVRWWQDIKSLAHWLSWSCSMSPGTAREHVRVARALRRMPTITAAFREGRLSYSKVREATRVVDLVDEAQLCELAKTATASQLARMVAGYRTAAGTRVSQQPKRGMSWTEREDGMVDLRVRLPKEEAALVIAALTAAKDQFGAPPESTAGESAAPTDPTPVYGYADAILDVARTFLDTAPEDRSGEDRTLVVVHVAAEQLADATAPIALTAQNVPAGTPRAFDPTCHLQGLGRIEPETARRLACDADILAAVVDADGEVLTLGRTRRLVSRALRRALMIRDGMCQFPHCHQTRHLKAHHLVPWSEGGPTDLDNLILLCQWHHTAVHEGGMRIVRADEPVPGRRWDAVMPDGKPHRDWYSPDGLANFLAQQVGRRQEEFESVIEGVDRFGHPDAARIQPGWRGERFDLHEAVQALFRMPVVRDDSDKAA
jgi:hypothetical protein